MSHARRRLSLRIAGTDSANQEVPIAIGCPIHVFIDKLMIFAPNRRVSGQCACHGCLRGRVPSARIARCLGPSRLRDPKSSRRHLACGLGVDARASQVGRVDRMMNAATRVCVARALVLRRGSSQHQFTRVHVRFVLGSGRSASGGRSDRRTPERFVSHLTAARTADGGCTSGVASRAWMSSRSAASSAACA